MEGRGGRGCQKLLDQNSWLEKRGMEFKTDIMNENVRRGRRGEGGEREGC